MVGTFGVLSLSVRTEEPGESCCGINGRLPVDLPARPCYSSLVVEDSSIASAVVLITASASYSGIARVPWTPLDYQGCGDGMNTQACGKRDSVMVRVGGVLLLIVCFLNKLKLVTVG